MNHHKNARLTFSRRLEMVLQVTQHKISLSGGEAALRDASSRPRHGPRAIDQAKAPAIVELRRGRLTQSRIAASLGVSESTVSRVLARAGLSKLPDLQPTEPIRRYEHAAPGDLLHIDTK